MSYNANVPLANQSIASTQSPIQTNFSLINSSSSGFAVDHETLTDPVNGGKHNKISFLQQGSDPTAATAINFLYSKLANSVNELFLERASNDGSAIIQLTTKAGNPVVGSSGTTFLPGALVLNYGIATVADSGAVTFATPFLTNCFVVVASITSSTAASSINEAIYTYNQSITGFNVRYTQRTFLAAGSGTVNIQYFAIGN